MHFKVTLTLAALSLTGCSPASASEPDSHNPAHCIAAFNYANHWLQMGHKTDLVRQGMARSLFEAQKLRSSGRSLAAAHAESAAVTKAYGNDSEKMFALAQGCIDAESADKQFNAEYQHLLALVDANPSTAE